MNARNVVKVSSEVHIWWDTKAFIVGKILRNVLKVEKPVRGHLFLGIRKFNVEESFISGIAFIWNSHLVHHQKSHSGEIPYEYNQCAKTFSQSSYLIGHQRIQSSEKPYCVANVEKNSGECLLLITIRLSIMVKGPMNTNVVKPLWGDLTLIRHHPITVEKTPRKVMCEKAFSLKSQLAWHKKSIILIRAQVLWDKWSLVSRNVLVWVELEKCRWKAILNTDHYE